MDLLEVEILGRSSDSVGWRVSSSFVMHGAINEPDKDSAAMLRSANIPAVLYGFVREHACDTLRRAGIATPVVPVLPPVDFLSAGTDWSEESFNSPLSIEE